MIERVATPQAIGVIVALMIVEMLLLLGVFRHRGDARAAGITLGNTLAGASLMGAVACEMSGLDARFTLLCLSGALLGHALEVWLRLR